MTGLILGCGCLVVLSSVFFLWPIGRGTRTLEASPGTQDQGDERQTANVEWYRQRREELRSRSVSGGEQEQLDVQTLRDQEALEADIALRLLEDEAAGPLSQTSGEGASSFRAWALLPLIAVLSGGLYYYLGAGPDVVLAQRMHAIDDATPALQVRQLMDDIAQRSRQRPDNLHYVGLLGRYYMGQEDYTAASRMYTALVEAVPEDAQALAYAAQARYLAAGRNLSDDARLLAEQALAADPNQRTALGLLGMASFEAAAYPAAIAYWERLQATQQPGSSESQMIDQVLAMARERLGQPLPGLGGTTGTVAGHDASATADDVQPDSPSGIGVSVRIVPPAAAVGRLNPADTVFVLARNAQSDSRMPVAVQRLQAADLPITLRLDDNNSMAGQRISALASVIVAVQVSPQGRPGEANASWLGQLGPVAPSENTEPLLMELGPGPLAP